MAGLTEHHPGLIRLSFVLVIPLMIPATMATTQPPDPKTFQSWEDAFAYPLPVVRKLESQLRTNIASNAQKLRSHVGTSYRSLLSTAERIIEMDEQIRTAEGHMSDIGRRCNARSVERVGENWRDLKKGRDTLRGERRDWRRIANVRVLQGAVEVVGRLVRKHGDALLAAKVLILGRLVLKSLGEEETKEEHATMLEELRKRLGTMRRKLLAYIGRILVKANVDRPTIVHALSAYSLIATSSPKEVLRYFLQVRFKQLQSRAEDASEAVLLEILDLYGQTLIDTRELFPKRLGESLSRLSEVAIVRDEGVRSVHELSLDVYDQWVAEDVRNFQPWVRLEQLASSDVQDALASWSKRSHECVLEALKDALGSYSDAHTVIQLRQKVISKHLALSARLGSDSNMQPLQGLRRAFLTRLEALAEDAASLSGIIANEAQASRPESGNPDPWELATRRFDLSGGALEYRTAVLQKQHGRDDLLAQPIEALDSWLSRLHQYFAAIASMRSTKWDDDLDLDLDDFSDDEPLQVVLSKHEPQRLEEKLHQATFSSLRATYALLEKTPETDSSPALLIRTLREVDQRRRGLEAITQGTDAIQASDTFVVGLHNRLAEVVAEQPIRRYTRNLQKPEHIAVALWDGSPALPTLPSPSSFRFLKMLHTDMSRLGTDLWSSQAVQTLKRHLSKSLDEKVLMLKIDQSLGMPLSNGHANNDDPSEGQQDKAAGEEEAVDNDEVNHHLMMQRLFDIYYLQLVFASGESGSQLTIAGDKLLGKMELDSATRERLKKNAGEYWKRTYLLFGLFANNGQVN